jgi:uncharacterized alkaline shock family protein YloU
MNAQEKQHKTKEPELPETHYIRHIDNEVFKGIILRCLLQVEGIAPIEGNFLQSLFHLSALDSLKGIEVLQNAQKRSIEIDITVNICSEENIPEKAEQIQTKVCEEITKATGVHVASIHVAFKKMISLNEAKRFTASLHEALKAERKES